MAESPTPAAPTKHTPGPWDDSTGLLLGAGGVPVAEPLPTRVGGDVLAQMPRIIADRALICAAPELLTALRALMDCLTAAEDANARIEPRDMRVNMQAARAALARAEGRS